MEHWSTHEYPPELVEGWATATRMYCNDVAQEAMVVTLSTMESRPVKRPADYFKTTASILARRGYDDLTEDKRERNHPGRLKRFSRLNPHLEGRIMNPLYSCGVLPEEAGEDAGMSERDRQRFEAFDCDEKTRPAPEKISPLKRAFNTNLQDWRVFGTLASSGPVRVPPPEPPEPIEETNPTPPPTLAPVKRRLPKRIAWDRTTGRYKVRLKAGGKVIYNRSFPTLTAAIRALEEALAQSVSA
jgi:hypothetical protein